MRHMWVCGSAHDFAIEAKTKLMNIAAAMGLEIPSRLAKPTIILGNARVVQGTCLMVGLFSSDGLTKAQVRKGVLAIRKTVPEACEADLDPRLRVRIKTAMALR